MGLWSLLSHCWNVSKYLLSANEFTLKWEAQVIFSGKEIPMFGLNNIFKSFPLSFLLWFLILFFSCLYVIHISNTSHNGNKHTHKATISTSSSIKYWKEYWVTLSNSQITWFFLETRRGICKILLSYIKNKLTLFKNILAQYKSAAKV